MHRLHKHLLQREGTLIMSWCRCFLSEALPPPMHTYFFFHTSIVIRTLKIIPFIKIIFRPSCDKDIVFRFSSVKGTENESHKSTETSSLPERLTSTLNEAVLLCMTEPSSRVAPETVSRTVSPRDFHFFQLVFQGPGFHSITTYSCNMQVCQLSSWF